MNKKNPVAKAYMAQSQTKLAYQYMKGWTPSRSNISFAFEMRSRMSRGIQMVDVRHTLNKYLDTKNIPVRKRIKLFNLSTDE